LRIVLALPLEALLPGASTVLDWPGELLPYQVDGVKALLGSKQLLLADDMGLGKTVQAIAAARILCIQREIERVLLVVPASLIDQWRRELMKWAPELRLMMIRGQASDRAWQWRSDAHVTIVSYETLRFDFEADPAFPPRRRLWDLIILDEAQRIKNREAGVSRQVKLLRRTRSWAMTGTPLENRLDDLASILEFVDAREEPPPVRYMPGPALLHRHREVQLRRRKVDVLDQLPPKRVITLKIPLLPGQRESYERAEQDGVFDLKEMGGEVRIQHVLELITRLKQICNADPASGESAKLRDIRERLSILSEQGNRALLFSQYTDERFGVAAAARALSAFEPLTYVGGMSTLERDAVIQRFKSDTAHKALILSLKAGGVGLNLQEASYVFHIDRWWNPAVEHQAEDRSHRMGQTVPVTVFKYTCEDTIEERIQTILESKQRLFEEIIDDVSIDVATRLTGDELFGLFGVESPTRVRSPALSRPSGLDLEERCARILSGHRWHVERTPRSRDGGVDLIATRTDEVGLQHTIFVQCKEHARAVGVEVVRELLGVAPVGQTVHLVLASPSGVTGDAAQLAAQRRVTIWNEAALIDLENSAPNPGPS
jgi:SNF2 family DNA or RNA helicase